MSLHNSIVKIHNKISSKILLKTLIHVCMYVTKSQSLIKIYKTPKALETDNDCTVSGENIIRFDEY
jgi:hypothetical protein